MKKLNISALNLVPVREGGGVKEAADEMVELAQHLDNGVYQRYWIAEHHNTTSIASSATRQLMHYTLAHTDSIRVGSGGVMLPNHSPLIVAEEMGTLQSLYGERVDIGLGRAPGTDMKTARAIRRNIHDGVFNFETEIAQLRDYLKDDHDGVVAFPGTGTEIPLYVLGSSTDSAYVAARLGLPYAFAAHFAPQQMKDAFEIYYKEFVPSRQLSEPYTIACLNVILAESNEEAAFLSTTMKQFVLNVIRNGKNKLQPPVEDMDAIWSSYERTMVEGRFPLAISGDIETGTDQLRTFLNQYPVNEIMAVSYIYDMDKLKHSYDLFAKIVETVNTQ